MCKLLALIIIIFTIELYEHNTNIMNIATTNMDKINLGTTISDTSNIDTSYKQTKHRHRKFLPALQTQNIK